jgi:hypothetical protein
MKTIGFVVAGHAVVLCAVVALGIWLNKPIQESASDYSGFVTVLSTAFGVYAFAINILYQKNRHVHFWINRLWLVFVRTHTFWKPSFDFTLASEERAVRTTSLLKAVEAIESSGMGTTKRGQCSATAASITLDDMMCVVVRFDGSHLHVTLDRKLLVPSHLYDAYRQKLARIADVIHHSVAPVHEARFCITVSFGDGVANPYYGFFVNRVPADLLSHFEVSFRLSRKSLCRIEAGKDFVNVDSTSVVEVFEALAQVVSLRAVPDGVSR